MASNVALKEKCEASLKILKDLKNKQGPGYIHERKVWEALGLHLMKNDAPWRLLYTHLKQIKRHTGILINQNRRNTSGSVKTRF